ncbi:NarK/NasA family nitrate transporter [Leucobacter viscericola]|uniref:NarK/NasA family nitrate transporter n=1 Tax=Leucobacter viscericola TaxID=2714935 RepID=A0A6G7XD25_9MICO|nr:MFS transporter [Leucobacter viscericola]QIK62510.1 NarK/NasA family nitrate transporter [Leucobacter viscericola]
MAQTLSDTSSTVVQRSRSTRDRSKVLWIGTIGFTLMFAVWLQFGVLSVPIAEEFGLTNSQVAWLISVAALNGSLWRLITGIMADRWGGRSVMAALMVVSAIPTYFVIYADSYTQLLIFAFLIGLAGNSFTIGVSWVSAWYPKSQQGLALGIFGAGNVGASVTKLVAPLLLAVLPAGGFLGGLIPGGWRFIPVMYALLLLVMAAITWYGSPRPDITPGAGVPLAQQFRVLKKVRVWRFSLYYVVVFGAYVALSGWMPTFYVKNFGLNLGLAALLTALFIFPASLLRPVGGWLSDKHGARPIMYISLCTMVLATGAMMVPSNVWVFTVLLFVVGIAMGVGKAAVFKHIPEYFPKDVGAVGGLVGLIGGLGAVALPPLFAYAQEWTGLSMQSATFGVLFGIALISLVWMQVVVSHDHRDRAHPATADRDAG